MIDWRRSALSDTHFVREREWQAAQSVMLWVDPSQSMDFTGSKDRAPKADRARLMQVLQNLLTNALRHTCRTTHITRSRGVAPSTSSTAC
mgnify:CR=1 FL=1